MDIIMLAPSEIRFSQDSISNTFRTGTNHTGQYIGETLDEIVRDPDTTDLIPNISVVNIDGKWFTSDNRRLWVFKKAEELGILSSIDVYVRYGIDGSKFTTSDGEYVRIRGNYIGGHLWQSLQRQMIEKQAREQREHTQRKQMEAELPRKLWEHEMERERQWRLRARKMETERQWKVTEQELAIERKQRLKTQMERERQWRLRARKMETERQWKVTEQELAIERKQRLKTQMEKDPQLKVTTKIVVAIIVLLFLYWATR